MSQNYLWHIGFKESSIFYIDSGVFQGSVGKGQLKTERGRGGEVSVGHKTEKVVTEKTHSEEGETYCKTVNRYNDTHYNKQGKWTTNYKVTYL